MRQISDRPSQSSSVGSPNTHSAAQWPIAHTIGVSASPAAGGTVSGGGTFASGTSQTVIATPNSGYNFVNWTESGSPVSASASYNFTLTGDRTLVANFALVTYTVAVSASPPAGGTVSGGGTFATGTSRTVTATPKPNYSFGAWTEGGNPVSFLPAYTFTLNGNRNLVARFNGPEFRVNTVKPSSQNEPEIARLKDGSFVIVWQSLGEDGSGYGVYGQRYSALGTRLGGEFPVNTFPTGDQRDPSVAALTGGGFVVVWASANEDTSGFGVYGQRFTASGARSGCEFRVNTFNPGDQRDPSVAGLSGGGFVVAWASANEDTSGFGVYGQEFTAAGAHVGSQFPVNTFKTGDQREPSVAGLTGGGFVVTWASANQDTSGFGVYGQRFDAAAARVASEFRVNTFKTGDQREPSVAGLTVGGFVVTWASANQDTSGFGVYGQRYGVSGARSGTEFRVNTFKLHDQRQPSVAALIGGGFVTVWSSAGEDGSGTGIYGQRFTAAGAPTGVEFPVNVYKLHNQSTPDVVGRTDGGQVATWTSAGEDGSLDGVYGIRLGPP